MEIMVKIELNIDREVEVILENNRYLFESGDKVFVEMKPRFYEPSMPKAPDRREKTDTSRLRATPQKKMFDQAMDKLRDLIRFKIKVNKDNIQDLIDTANRAMNLVEFFVPEQHRESTRNSIRKIITKLSNYRSKLLGTRVGQRSRKRGEVVVSDGTNVSITLGGNKYIFESKDRFDIFDGLAEDVPNSMVICSTANIGDLAIVPGQLLLIK